MSRARTIADYASTGVTAAEFDFLDTTSGTPGSGTFLRGDKTWVAAGSTSASDLDSGTLATARMAAGTIIKSTTHVSLQDMLIFSAGSVEEADAYDITVSCTIANKLHIWIIGGYGTAAAGNLGAAPFQFGMRIEESGESDVDVYVGALYSRGSSSSAEMYKYDTTPSVMYTHTAVTASVTIKRLLMTPAFEVGWFASGEGTARYLIMEEQV